MKNPLFSRLPFYRTPGLGVDRFPEHIRSRSFANGALETGALTPAYRLPEFVIQREISDKKIVNIFYIEIGGGTFPVTFQQDVEVMYYQDLEYQYACFIGQDLPSPLSCGYYFYGVLFQGESDFYYSQVFQATDAISENEVPIGYVRLRASADCKVGKIPYHKWPGFKQELWLKTDEVRGEILTTRETDSDDVLQETLTGLRIDKSNLLVARCTMGESDLLYAMQAYNLHTLEYWKGKGDIDFDSPDEVLKLEVIENPDYELDEEYPIVRARVYVDQGSFGTLCCDTDIDCDPNVTVTPTWTQAAPESVTFNVTLPSEGFPEGYWAEVVATRESDGQSLTFQTDEATITSVDGFDFQVQAGVGDDWSLKVVIRNFGDCEWESEEALFSVGGGE